MLLDADTRLLLQLVAASKGRAEQSALVCNVSDIDWTGLVETALRHQQASLLYKKLCQAGLAEIPDDIKGAFEFYVENTRARNQQLQDSLLAVIGALNSVGIRPMPIKGPLLAERLHEDIGSRLFRDIDLLIRDEDVDKALSVVLEMGYERHHQMSDTGFRETRRYGGQYILFHRQSGIAIEPHWRLTPSTLAIELDYPGIWQNATATAWNEVDILVPSPEDEFLFLCVHGAKEHWPSLKPIVDLAYFVHQNAAMDWSVALRRADELGCGRIARVGIELLARTELVDLPAVLNAQLGHDRVAVRLAEEALTRSAVCGAEEVDIYSVQWYQFRQRERWGDRLRYLSRTLLTPRAKHYEWLPLPSSLRALYPGVKLLHDYVFLPVNRFVHRFTAVGKTDSSTRCSIGVMDDRTAM